MGGRPNRSNKAAFSFFFFPAECERGLNKITQLLLHVILSERKP